MVPRMFAWTVAAPSLRKFSSDKVNLIVERVNLIRSTGVKASRVGYLAWRLPFQAPKKHFRILRLTSTRVAMTPFLTVGTCGDVKTAQAAEMVVEAGMATEAELNQTTGLQKLKRWGSVVLVGILIPGLAMEMMSVTCDWLISITTARGVATDGRSLGEVVLLAATLSPLVATILTRQTWT